MELVLGDTLAHRARTRHATLDHLQQLIHVVRTGPLLVLDDIDTTIHLRLLHQLAVGTHALAAVGAAELVGDQRRGVQTRERDELPAVAQLRETRDVGLLLRAWHRRLPVERWRQVVRQLLLGPHGVHAASEVLGLLVVWQLRLHPDGVGVWRIGDGTVDAALDATLQTVVALARAWVVPVPEDLGAEDAAGDGARLWVALALHVGSELGDDGLGAWAEVGGLDGCDGGLGEGLEAGGGGPLVLNGLQLGAGLAGVETSDQELVERLELWVGRAEDEGMVAGIDGGGDEGRGLGVSAGNGQEVGACRY